VYQGAVAVTGCRFIYEPLLGALGQTNAWPPGLQPSYVVKFFGRPVDSNPLLERFSPAYSVWCENSAHQGIYGVHEAPTVQSNLIPDVATATRYGNLWLAENIRLSQTISLSLSICNPWIDPANTVAINIGLAGMSGVRWYTESVTISGDATGAAMTIECSRGTP
jgi:hypothetical protein